MVSQIKGVITAVANQQPKLCDQNDGVGYKMQQECTSLQESMYNIEPEFRETCQTVTAHTGLWKNSGSKATTFGVAKGNI